jgi:NitT/TauT family transport system substrate-binding protein
VLDEACPRMRRSSWIGLTSAAVAAVPLRASAQAVAPLRIGVIPAEVAAEAFYAVEQGFFKSNGLDVDLQSFNNGGAIASAVAGGALDVGLSDLLSVITAHSHGLPFAFLAPGALSKNDSRDSVFGLLTRPEDAIREPRDFNGKTFATNALHNIGQLFAEAWIDANGGDSKTTHWVEMPYPALIPALMQAKTVQVVGTNEPWMTVGKDAGARTIYYEHNAISPTVMLSGWITTRDWVAKNAGVAVKFAAAMRDAARWANRNRAAAGQILARYTKLPPATVENMHRSEFAETFDPAAIVPTIDAAAKYGIVPKPFPMSEIVVSL